MKESLLDLLACRACSATDVSLGIEEKNGEGEILEGSVACKACNATLRVSRGVLRAVESDHYTKSFSFQWQLHKRTQLDNAKSDKSRRVFLRKTGLSLEDLEGKRVLDVGVGTGRFADVIQRAGADVTGIDLSYSVETAMENVGHRRGVNIVQADVFDLPFARESFDLIYSIGVLDHTPDCRKAFLGLVPYLRPGGTIVIWVYDAHNWSPGSVKDTTNRFWRSITRRLPPRVLYALCVLGLPLYFFRRIPGAEQIMHLALPGFVYHAIPETNTHPDIREHLLDTFDWYGTYYLSKHTYPEVFSWFAEAGLEGVRVLPHPVSMSGHRPSNEARAESEMA